MSLDRHRSDQVSRQRRAIQPNGPGHTRHSPDSDLKRFLPSKNEIWEWVGGLLLSASSGVSRSQISTGVTGGADSRETRVCNWLVSEFQMVDSTKVDPTDIRNSVADVRKYQNRTPREIERF